MAALWPPRGTASTRPGTCLEGVVCVEVDDTTLQRGFEWLSGQKRPLALYARKLAGRKIGEEEWPKHLDGVTDFWETALLGAGTYRRNPLGPHLSLGLHAEHFDRWLQLFGQTAHEVFPRQVADSILNRARRMAGHLEKECEAWNVSHGL